MESGVIATLSTHLSGAASVQLTANGSPVATYPVTHDDGPGPIPAATAVLERHGWTMAGDWVQEFGGITGNVWTATAEKATEGAMR
jgi:hypothetical protein